jgi:hypothetical protein
VGGLDEEALPMRQDGRLERCVARASAIALMGLIACNREPAPPEATSKAASSLCIAPTLTASAASPQPVGAIVGLTATAACAAGQTPEYRFLVRAGGGPYQELRGWATSPSALFDTAGFAAGQYALAVHVRASGANKPESTRTLHYLLGETCGQPAVSTTPASPSSLGAPVTIAALASCTGAASPQFRYSYRVAGTGAWTVFQDFTQGSASWSTDGLGANSYALRVETRADDYAGPSQASTVVNHVLGGLCATATLGISPASPKPLGTLLTLNAGATCSSGAPEFRFEYLQPGSTAYTELRGWGGPNIGFDSTAHPAGLYSFRTQVRAIGGASSAQASKSRNFLLGDVCDRVSSLTASPPGPQPSGTIVQLSAAAACVNGGTPEYQFSRRLEGTPAWTLLRAWGAESAAFDTSGLAAGTHQVKVETRGQGHLGVAESSRILDYLVTPPCTGVVCTPLDACHEAGSCDPTSGQCSNPPKSIDDGDPCTMDSCDAVQGPSHVPIAGCGQVARAPLPPPPDEILDAPASRTFGGVELIDPDGVLGVLAVEAAPLPGSVASQVGNGDSAWEISPSGELPGIAYVRFTLADALVTGTKVFLWSSQPGGGFSLQSLGKTTAGGTKVVFAIRHFSAQIVSVSCPRGGLVNLGGADDAMARVQSTGRCGVRHALARTTAESDETLAEYVAPHATFQPADGTSLRLWLSETGRDAIWQDGASVFSTGGLADGGSTPSLSADGRHAAYLKAGEVRVFDALAQTSASVAGSANSERPVISRSGRYVAFATDGLDPAGGIFVHDLELAITSRLADLPSPYLTSEWTLAPFASAVSDGGRYVFLTRRGFETGACLRVDRTDGSVADMSRTPRAVDRSGRTAIFQSQSEYERIVDLKTAGFVTRDLKNDFVVTSDFDLRDLHPTFFEEHADDPPFEYSVFFAYEFDGSGASTGAVSPDGSTVAFVFNRDPTEGTRHYDLFTYPVPHTTPAPSFTGPVVELQPFTLAWQNMAAELDGDLAVLRAPSGTVLQIIEAHGQASGQVEVPLSLPGGSYPIDVYYMLDGDPPTLTHRGQFPVIVPGVTPTADITKRCEFEPIEASVSGFPNYTGGTSSSGDYVALFEVTPTPAGDIETEIERRYLNGQPAAQITFFARRDEGVRLRVRGFVELPDTVSAPRHHASRGEDTVDVTACLSAIAAASSPPFLITDLDTPKIYYTESMAISADAATIFHRDGDDVVRVDRRLGTEATLASGVHGFGASPSGSFIAYAAGTDLVVVDTASLSTRVLTGAFPIPTAEETIEISDDGRTLVQTRQHDLRTEPPAWLVRGLAIWNLSGEDPLEVIVTAGGFMPSMSADGRWLVFTNHASMAVPPSDTNWSGLRARLVDLLDPVQFFEGDPHPFINSHYIEMGIVDQLGGSSYVNSLRAEISADGNRLLNVSDFNNSTSPYQPGCGDFGLDAFVRDRSGSGEIELDQAFRFWQLGLLRNDGSVFMVPCAEAVEPGVYRWTAGSGAVLVATGASSEVGDVADGKRRVAFRAVRPEHSGSWIYVAPY